MNELNIREYPNSENIEEMPSTYQPLSPDIIVADAEIAEILSRAYLLYTYTYTLYTFIDIFPISIFDILI